MCKAFEKKSFLRNKPNLTIFSSLTLVITDYHAVNSSIPNDTKMVRFEQWLWSIFSVNRHVNKYSYKKLPLNLFKDIKFTILPTWYIGIKLYYIEIFLRKWY